MLANESVARGIPFWPSQARLEARPFVGTWSAKHNGVVYVQLEVRDAQSLSGRILTGTISADEDGRLIDVLDPATSEYALLDVRVSKGKLTFRTKDPGGEITEYEMTMTTAGRGSLRIAGAPLRPFTMTRRE
jgi:hypothetical protein